jgi:hypothetical protein
VCTDAWKEGLNGFLMQNGHLIFYDSKKMKEHEINYATHDLELVAIVNSIRMWRRYFMGKNIELRKDHMLEQGLNIEDNRFERQWWCQKKL